MDRYRISCPECEAQDITLEGVEYHPNLVDERGTAVLSFRCGLLHRFQAHADSWGRGIYVKNGPAWNTPLVAND